MGLIAYVVRGRGTTFIAPPTPLKMGRLLLKNIEPFIVLQTTVPSTQLRCHKVKLWYKKQKQIKKLLDHFWFFEKESLNLMHCIVSSGYVILVCRTSIFRKDVPCKQSIRI